MSLCPSCQSDNHNDSVFCRECGHQLSSFGGLSAATVPPPRSRRETSKRQFLAFGLTFLLLAWLGAAGIAYGAKELTGGGPQGDQGQPGPAGSRGAQGPAGRSAVGSDLALRRLALSWACERIAQERTGVTSCGDPQVEACIDYIMEGTGSFVECGFQR